MVDADNNRRESRSADLDLVVPSPALDPVLDACAACAARHGIKRLTISDIARELGVSRTTVRRHVTTTDEALRLLIARELARFIDRIPTTIHGSDGPDAVIAVLVALVRDVSSNPVVVKILDHEPELIGHYFPARFTDAYALGRSALAEVLTALLGEPVERSALVVDWLERITVSLILMPPQDLETSVRTVVAPLLAAHSGRAPRPGKRSGQRRQTGGQ